MEKLDNQIKKYIKINKTIDRVIIFIIMLCFIYVGFSLFDDYKFTHGKIGHMKYRDFDELRKINPDVVGWITIDDTSIDYPVVQADDNFFYLNRSFEGETYSGGSIFLDYENSKDFSDEYNILHGHFITNGAMFGDIPKFKDKKFFDKRKTGTLITPDYDYDLEIINVSSVDAYDYLTYSPKIDKETAYKETQRNAVQKRDIKLGKSRAILLSTCSGEMNNNRVALFCKMIKKGKHR